jgi:hypothetical protein
MVLENSVPPSPRPISRFLRVAAWLPFLFLLTKSAILALPTYGVDFMVYHGAARMFLNGENPYLHQEALPGPMTYPVFGLLWCVPFAWLPLSMADTAWDLFQLALLGGTVALLIFGYRPRPGGEDAGVFLRPGCSREPFLPESDLHRFWPLIVPLLVATFTPACLEFVPGNIQQLNLFLVTLLGVALLRGRETLAGVVLAALCGIKVLPVVLFPALWVAGKRRTLAVCGVALAGYGMLLLATGWWRYEVDLFTRLMPQFSTIGLDYNGTLTSVALVVGKSLCPSLLESRAVFGLAAKGFGLAVGLIYLATLWLGRAHYRRVWPDGVTLGLLTMVLACPVATFAHFSYILPGYVWLFLSYLRTREHVYFVLSLIFWGVVFGTRVGLDLAPSPRISFPDMALVALGGLWVVNIVRGVCLARRVSALPTATD